MCGVNVYWTACEHLRAAVIGNVGFPVSFSKIAAKSDVFEYRLLSAIPRAIQRDFTRRQTLRFFLFIYFLFYLLFFFSHSIVHPVELTGAGSDHGRIRMRLKSDVRGFMWRFRPDVCSRPSSRRILDRTRTDPVQECKRIYTQQQCIALSSYTRQ